MLRWRYLDGHASLVRHQRIRAPDSIPHNGDMASACPHRINLLFAISIEIAYPRKKKAVPVTGRVCKAASLARDMSHAVFL